MIVNKADYIGERMTWENLVDLFPNRWVILKDCKYSVGYEIINGILVEVLDFDAAIEYVNKHKDEQLVYDCTTSDVCENMGYIHGEYVKA
jgi:hypothetical protein